MTLVLFVAMIILFWLVILILEAQLGTGKLWSLHSRAWECLGRYDTACVRRTPTQEAPPHDR
jgi:hypothetical protein